MQTQHILSANILDILFEGRNTNYGAYDLRKNYHKRITYALIITFLLCLLFTIGSIFANGKKENSNGIVTVVVSLKNTKNQMIRLLSSQRKLSLKYKSQLSKLCLPFLF